MFKSATNRNAYQRAALCVKRDADFLVDQLSSVLHSIWQALKGTDVRIVRYVDCANSISTVQIQEDVGLWSSVP